ncbi:hypothetical protein DRQ53_02495 [bacterium]|nr:MAG: hypothetical protein DRQ32_00605 [bacterium]RKZ17761.1 MAG: hypothetical protein DRQ53_02495 [bacterium]
MVRIQLEHARLATLLATLLVALLVACCLLMVAVPVFAQGMRPGELGHFTIARLHYAGGGDWYSNQSSLPNLLMELQRRTGVPTTEREAIVTLDDESLFNYPMLYVTGHGVMRPIEADLSRLREWLDAGGFLWVDDNYGLDASFRESLARLYPDDELVALDGNHPIYSAYYELPGLPKVHEHDGLPAQGFALFHSGRMKIFYSFSSDIGDGLEDVQVHNDSAEVREAAMRMAINICYFALTQS